LANVGDIDTMAAKAIEILSSAEKLNTFKRQARQNAKRFDIHEILPIYERLYHNVLEAAKISH
jgi:ribosomal protein L17